jgi:acyl-CoA thioesterase-2
MTCAPRPATDLAELLQLDPVGSDRFRSDRFERNVHGQLFGGQYLGQAMAAALLTADGRAPQTMVGFFLSSAGGAVLDWHVHRVRDGRAFAHRRVLGCQAGTLCFSAEVLLHDPEPDTPEHRAVAPDVPPPEHLNSLPDLARSLESRLSESARLRLTSKLLVDLRPVDPESLLQSRGLPSSACWIKPLDFASDQRHVHFAALAYLSDYWANVACRLPHADSAFSGDLTALSLNHTLRVHGPVHVDDWMLFVVDSPACSGGVGTNRGLIFDRQGQLIASMAQDALTRRVRVTT